MPGASFPGRSQNSIRLDSQGLRAFAVPAVLVCFAEAKWLKAGFVGVCVFFVISGFIITALLSERGENVEPGAFHASRVKRILPAYLAMLLVVCGVTAMPLLPADATIRRIANSVPGVTFIDMSAAELFKQAPYYQGALIYLDNHYLNPLGAREYGHVAAGQFRQVFNPLIANKSSEP